MKLSDQVHYGFGREEGGTIADVVNDHETISPVDLLIESGFPLARLQRNHTCIMYLKEHYHKSLNAKIWSTGVHESEQGQSVNVKILTISVV